MTRSLLGRWFMRQHSRRAVQEIGERIGCVEGGEDVSLRPHPKLEELALSVAALFGEANDSLHDPPDGRLVAVFLTHMTSFARGRRGQQWQHRHLTMTSCQPSRHNGWVLKSVAVVALDGFSPFELSVPCEVFGVDRSEEGLPCYDFAVVAGESGPLRSDVGFTLHTDIGLDRLGEADLVIVPAPSDERFARADWPEPLLDALRSAVARGGRVLSVCTGAFVLGAAGLLDGRSCTTHWRHARELAIMYPTAKVDPAVLYVDEGQVITSAGTAAGIDACLYLVRKEQGSRVANAIARRMVVPPHRDGGQAQFVERPLAALSCDTLAEVIDWMQRHLDQQVSVKDLAGLAAMSPRTFARRFVQETGTTPQRWLIGQRVLLAEQMLEESDETVDVIAERAGFGNATALRHHFRALRATTPHSYRRLFQGSA